MGVKPDFETEFSNDMQQAQERLRLLLRVMRAGRGQDDSVTLSKHVMAAVLEDLLTGLVDEEWYLTRYPDVAAAVERGAVTSAREHYAVSGLYEGRAPCALPLDEVAYLKAHQDVAASVRAGDCGGALEHFLSSGFAEGRSFKLRSGNPGQGEA